MVLHITEMIVPGTEKFVCPPDWTGAQGIGCAGTKSIDNMDNNVRSRHATIHAQWLANGSMRISV